jgi:hypothetical protein
MEEKEEEVRDRPIGYCYTERNCTGTKVSNSKIEEQVCRDLDGESWENSDTGECVNF